MNNAKKDDIFLIDANSLIHRAFHALPPLTSPDGAPVQALYGVASILLKLWKEEKLRYAAALFDRPEPTFRKEWYEAYKAQRAKAPDELVSQLIEAHRLFEVFGIPVFEAPGWEADDLIATLARRFGNASDARVVILTGDLDTLQLVEDDHVVVRALKTGISDTVLYDEAAVKARYGLAPRQLIDYKALVGDASDNVKGVPGVGPKTAAQLLQKFGTLEKFYAAASSDERLAKKVLPHRDAAALAKILVTLRDDAPLIPTPREALAVPPTADGARAYFEKFGFRALIKRMGGEISAALPAVETIATNKKDVPAVALPAHRSFGEAKALPAHAVVRDDAARPFPSGDVVKVGFGIKNILKRAWRAEKDLPPPYWDLGVAAWLLDPDSHAQEPAQIFQRLAHAAWGGSDAHHEALFAHEHRALAEAGLLDVFRELEMPLLRVLGEMEQTGIILSREQLATLLAKTDDHLALLERGIFRLAGEEFNLNSPREVGKILFEKLGIHGAQMKTPGGKRSTREEALLSLADGHPIVKSILEHREFFKIRSTYLAPLLARIEKDGRVRTEFLQTGAATGRLSSQAPNLQNIPQNFIWAKELRAAFVAPADWSFLTLDYTQLELRILAAVSGDPELIGACARGEDLHRLTASRALGIPLENVGDKERRLAKTLNFGLAYGMGARAFAQAAGISGEEAKRFIARYFKTFTHVKEWQESVKAEARATGFVQTFSGRRRYLPAILSPAPQFRAEAERAAINHPIQGLGADIMKRAMIGMREEFRARGWDETAHLLLSIHDELLLEVRDDMMEAIAPRARAIMEQAYPLKVPLTVKVAAGKDWGHLTPVNG
ncbi:MAG: hypothetical protein HYY10_02385 [Candidatus Liptonbacteria bacterium]|nr:hypothetical protein [Candidatus Liptonbacteria bacterium]